MTTDYNGWSNYETFAVAVGINANAEMQENWDNQAQGCWREANGSPVQAKQELALRMEAWVRANDPLGSDTSMYSGLINGGIANVDWEELADNWLIDIVGKPYEEDVLATSDV